MNPLLLFLEANWKGLLAGLVAVLLVFYVQQLRVQLANARTEVAEFKSAYDLLAAKVVEQNAAIDDMNAQGEKKKAAYTSALAEAKKRASASQREAEWLAGQLDKPDSGGKGCKEAFSEWRAAR